MPDPRTLRVGDRVVFTALPDEWSEPGYRVPRDSRALLRALIARGRASRVQRVDAHGVPWIEARLRDDRGTLVHQYWGITQRSGWRRVRPRPRG